MADTKKRAHKRSKSSARWLARQRRDPFARLASAQGKGSRAHFKLEQLDRRFRLIRPGMRVLELGAAPGGWTRYLESRVGSGGLVVAVDCRPVHAGGSVRIVTGSIGEADVDDSVDALLGGRTADLVLSDMAPNISGIRAADQARSMELVDLADAAAERWLKLGGTLVVKVFQGEGVAEWIQGMRRKYAKFRLVKPEASRPDSREMYAVAERYRGSE